MAEGIWTLESFREGSYEIIANAPCPVITL